MRIRFIRHGESIHNVEFLKFGESAYNHKKCEFSSLTENGIRQALSKRDPSVKIVFSSTLPRTLQTSSLMFPNAKIYAFDCLRECNFQHRCNRRKSRSEIELEYPGCTTDCSDDSDLIFDSGFDDLEERFRKTDKILFDNDIIKDLEEIIIVSHRDYIIKYLEYRGIIIDEINNCEECILYL